MKKKTNARRGLAIETAIIAMLLTFGLCLMLVNISLFAINGKKARTSASERLLSADQIGEEYYAHFAHDAVLKDREGYAYTYRTTYDDENNEIACYTVTKDGATVIYFEVKTTDKSILRWSYLPPQD